jgi:hypothetical protein
VAVTEYEPMGRYANEKRPAEFVTARLEAPVASFLASIFAFGIALPVGSVTAPVTVAVFTCPRSALPMRIVRKM